MARKKLCNKCNRLYDYGSKCKCKSINETKTTYQKVKYIYYTKQWKIVSNRVLWLDEYKCRCCGSRDNLSVHHIYKLTDRIDLAYDIDNLITLCGKCHTQTDTNYDSGKLPKLKYERERKWESCVG